MDFWDLTIRFFSLSDANVQNVVAGSILLGCVAGCLSTFAYLQKKSLLGDALAHSALPGVGIAFLVVGYKHLPSLLIGAAITAWLGALAVNLVVRKTKIKLDSALGIVLSVLFGLGIVILTHIQKSGAGSQSGLDKFLFGQAAAISGDDVKLLFWVTVVMLTVVVIGFSRFKLLSFDPGFARAIGVNVSWLQFVLTTMLVLAVVVGLQAVGVVLMAAMLMTPAAAARQWTDRLGLMTVLAAAFGMLAGLMGAYVSFLAPKLPTGPWIVIVISVIFGLSLLFAPGRGVVSRWLSHVDQRNKITREHVLKVLYNSGANDKRWADPLGLDQITTMWSFARRELKSALSALRRQGFVMSADGGFHLTDNGVIEGARIVRLHRLWEVYLTQVVNLPPDHVHRDAHDMEHVLTPELEDKLEKLLGRPQFDPHNQEIPYIQGEATK